MDTKNPRRRSTDAPPPPPATLDEALGAIESLNSKLNLVRVAYTTVLVILVGCTFAFGVIMYRQTIDRHADEIRSCMSGNEARKAIAEGIDGIRDALLAASPPDRRNTPEARAFNADIDAHLVQLEPREC